MRENEPQRSAKDWFDHPSETPEAVQFPALQTAIFLGKLVSGLVAGLGVLIPAILLMDGDGIDAMTLGISIAVLLFGIFAFAFFEFLSVVIHIEKNTREQKDASERILARMENES